MEQGKVIQIKEQIVVNELATALGVPVATLIGELFKNGIVATINQSLDYETVEIIIDELGLDVKLERVERTAATLKRHVLTDKATERPPVVAVMGHVDHGKTTLLDAILQTKVVEREAGGITQYISAYQTEANGKNITLLDTPGHEAFAAVRQHGAILTDIVVIVVAADDGVKPQTVEAIKFAQSANAKIIVAINKIDKPTADANRVMAQLAADHHLNPEEWGGDTIMVPVSAKENQGIDKLLESILLVAELEELKADYDTEAEGLVVESQLEHGKGAVVGLLVQQGELKVGDFLVAGSCYGKVRTMVDYKGNKIDVATPSTPVTVTGFKQLPQFGWLFQETSTERQAKHLANKARIASEQNVATSNVTGSDLLSLISKQAEVKDLNLVIKADVQGSLTSIQDSLKLIDAKEVQVNIVHSGIGNISENDLNMAVSEQVIIYGFNVDIASNIKRMASAAGVKVRTYRVIYELLDDVKLEMEKLLPPEIKENEVGKLKVKGVFKIAKEQLVAGGLVTKGRVEAGLLARVKRGKEQIAEVEVTSVEKNKQEVKDVVSGELCGLLLKTNKKVQLQIDDTLEFFSREIIPRKIK